MRAYIESYGCWLSKGEAEIMRQLLAKEGYAIVESPGEADVVVINTCAVRGDTERKMLKRIAELYALSRRKGSKLVVAGCLVNVRPALIARIAPTASLLEPDALEQVAEAVKDRVVIVREYKPRRSTLPIHSGGHTYVIPVQTGCLGSCRFCVGKVARMRLFSYPMDAIVKHVRDAVRGGAKQVFLVGQDLAAYGRDRGTTLSELLRALLEEVDGDYRIRVGMMEPHTVSTIAKPLVQLMKDPRVCNYLHLPLQSGDDRILRLMNRKYTVKEYKSLVAAFRERLDRLNLVTDVIVGYPGEGEKEFSNTVNAVKEIVFDKVHVARYTLRPFTAAYVMERQVPEPEKKRRSSLMSKVAAEVGLLANRRYVGLTAEALVEGAGTRGYILRLRSNYKPVVVHDPVKVGEIVEVRIVGCSPFHLVGKVIR